MGPFPIVTEDCDSNGVVLHGNSHYRPLPATQTQLDMLRVMKQLITSQLFFLKFLYVQSHSDDTKEWSACRTKERMNIKVDCLAKQSLLNAYHNNEYFDSSTLLEDFCIYMNEHKVTGPIKSSLEAHWGRMEAQRFLNFKKLSIQQIST